MHTNTPLQFATIRKPHEREGYADPYALSMYKQLQLPFSLCFRFVWWNVGKICFTVYNKMENWITEKLSPNLSRKCNGVSTTNWQLFKFRFFPNENQTTNDAPYLRIIYNHFRNENHAWKSGVGGMVCLPASQFSRIETFLCVCVYMVCVVYITFSSAIYVSVVQQAQYGIDGYRLWSQGRKKMCIWEATVCCLVNESASKQKKFFFRFSLLWLL